MKNLIAQQTLRKEDDSLVVSIPDEFAKWLGLTEGSTVYLNIRGRTLMVDTEPKRYYALNELVAEMSDGFPESERLDEQDVSEKRNKRSRET